MVFRVRKLILLFQLRAVGSEKPSKSGLFLTSRAEMTENGRIESTNRESKEFGTTLNCIGSLLWPLGVAILIEAAEIASRWLTFFMVSAY